ncbi:UxaA family hydrolase [Ferviditalea candida]|uniref:UxaA family hydrolase n=1 Tax=Ferviditalea candida TaxID=3108399 RepID=A0ABU5ZN01_9BACL|nr:UxaA family hydrolase [Paenibacillaceae bacterium T2]
MAEKQHKIVMMKPHDKVAVALEPLSAGTTVNVRNAETTLTVQLKDSIEFGHKFAVVPIAEGEDILKYGEVIGMATRAIEVGEHVHIHNLEGKRGRGDKIGANG